MKSYTPPLHFTERKATRRPIFSYPLPLHTAFYALLVPPTSKTKDTHTTSSSSLIFFQHQMESFRKIAKNIFKTSPITEAQLVSRVQQVSIF